ncbi:hypothetical protein L227DRAFT_570420 [Lentinus tigrinus ALCF2SS1-6]|uniref:Uncharacterized protein n=1 Tax=Lentinus tigrinus ALCF2SS1-6 TaxID=1328759 RepID=A0A5C2SRP7_9APHY|nr:hypothetical protein L227DRAFT_570420 [Lentinus tigrinus ALCF2SS1-6]
MPRTPKTRGKLEERGVRRVKSVHAAFISTYAGIFVATWVSDVNPSDGVPVDVNERGGVSRV